MTDQTDGDYDFRDAGWGLTVDPEADELTLEHIESATTYVFDAAGNLTVPGDPDAGGDISALQETLAAAMEGNDQGTTSQQTSPQCAIECDESTGEVTIESQDSITLDAPAIDITAGNSLMVESSGNLDVSAAGNGTLTSTGVLTLNGSLIKLN